MSWIAIAATVVGGAVSATASSQAGGAMNDQFKAELARQQGYRNQGFGAVNAALPGMGRENADAQIAQGAQGRMAGYQGLAGMNLGAGVTPFSAVDQGKLNLLGQRRAQVGGYSDWQLGQTIDRIRLQESLNKISDFAGGDARVFPYQMYKAQHSADDLAFLGKAIGSVGGAAGGYMNNQSGGGAGGMDPSLMYGMQANNTRPPDYSGMWV